MGKQVRINCEYCNASKICQNGDAPTNDSDCALKNDFSVKCAYRGRYPRMKRILRDGR